MRLNMDCSGNKFIMESVVSPSNNFQRKIPLNIPSKTCQRIKKPNANADRLTNTPKKRQKEKKPVSFTKNANRNSKSVKMIDNSLKSE